MHLVRADVRLCLYRDRARPDAPLPRHPGPLQGPAPGHPARAAGGTPGLQLGRRSIQVKLINSNIYIFIPVIFCKESAARCMKLSHLSEMFNFSKISQSVDTN